MKEQVNQVLPRAICTSILILVCFYFSSFCVTLLNTYSGVERQQLFLIFLQVPLTLSLWGAAVCTIHFLVWISV